MSKVVSAAWANVALDLVGATSERARALTLACGHTVYRRVSWMGGPSPDDTPAPKRAICELCAGLPAKHRLAEDVEREHYEFLHKRYGRKRRKVRHPAL